MITIITRYAVALLGLTLLYLAFFITMDEQGKIGNRLEELWKRVRKFQSVAMSWQAAFLQTIAEVFQSAIKSSFGSELFSLRYVAVAATLCALPNILFFLFEPANLFVKILLVVWMITVALKASEEPTVGGIFATFLLSLCPTFYRAWSRGLFDFPATERAQALKEMSTILAQSVLLPVLVAFIVGVLGVILFIALNNVLLRHSSVASGSPFMLLLVLVANIVLAAIYLAPLLGPDLLLWQAFDSINSSSNNTPLIMKLMVINPDHPFWFEVWTGIKFLSVLVVLPALSALLIILLIVTMLLHRLIWPFIWRPLYAAH